MTDPYVTLLDAAIAQLGELKADGVRFVDVHPETLKALATPVSRAQPIAAPANTPAPRFTPSAPSQTPSCTPTPATSRPASPATPSPAPSPAPAPFREPTPVYQLAPAPPVPPTPPPSAPPVPAPAEPRGTPFSSPRLTLGEKRRALAELRERTLACQKCPHLAASRRNVVFGVGNPDAVLMFIGEEPGADEDAEGEPFVGPAGQLLTKIIKAMDFTRDLVYIANILKCRPDTPGQSFGNRPPGPDEMATCIPYLLSQIEIVRPQVIVSLGATATKGLLGVSSGINQLRGRWQDFRGIPLMPTFHPSYLLHNPDQGEKRKVWEDMLLVLTRLDLPISEKQRSYFQTK